VADARQALGDWPGTKNGRNHRVALSGPTQELIDQHLAEKSSRSSGLLKKLVADLKPSALRRTI
jgi:hypothetical protein